MPQEVSSLKAVLITIYPPLNPPEGRDQPCHVFKNLTDYPIHTKLYDVPFIFPAKVGIAVTQVGFEKFYDEYANNKIDELKDLNLSHQTFAKLDARGETAAIFPPIED